MNSLVVEVDDPLANEPSDGLSNVWVAASDGDLVRVAGLIQAGAGVDARDENGYTPLHAAASYGHLDMLRFLLNAGAQVNVRDNDGDCPLHYCEEGASARVLVSFGADPRVLNDEGKSPVDSATEEGQTALVSYLQSALMPTIAEGEGGDAAMANQNEDFLLQQQQQQQRFQNGGANSSQESPAADNIGTQQQQQQQQSVFDVMSAGGGGNADVNMGGNDQQQL